MKPNRNIKKSHYFSDSEISKRNKACNVEKNTQKKNPYPPKAIGKKSLFSSDFSIKAMLDQLLSEEVYDDLVSLLLVIVSLPLILIKRFLNVLSWLYKQIDNCLSSLANNVSSKIEEKKKSRFEKRRFSKDMRLELIMKKKQIEQKAKICQSNKMDLVLDLDETLIHCTDKKPTFKAIEFEVKL